MFGFNGNVRTLPQEVRVGVYEKEAFKQRWEGVMSLDVTGRKRSFAGREKSWCIGPEGRGGRGKTGARCWSSRPALHGTTRGSYIPAPLSPMAPQASLQTVIFHVCSETSLGKCPEIKVLDQTVFPF